MTMQRVVVTGGTGFVGRSLCAAFAARGVLPRLLVPTRRRVNGRTLGALPNVDVVEADVHDRNAWPALLDGADAVVNLVAILHGQEAGFDRAHVQLPRTIAAACLAAGVRRVVHVSALGVDAQAPSLYLRSKAAGEAVWRDSGLAVTILRPSVIFGADDRFTNLFASLQRLVPVLPLAGAHARFQPVWVGDVARAIITSLERPATAGQTIECAGPEVLTLAEIVRRSGRGHARPVLPLPEGLAMLQAAAMEWLPGEPLMSRDNVRSMRVPNVAGGSLPGLASLDIDARRLPG